MDHQKLIVNGDIINEPRHISNLEQSLVGYVLNNSGCGMKHSTSHVPDTQELTSYYFSILHSNIFQASYCCFRPFQTAVFKQTTFGSIFLKNVLIRCLNQWEFKDPKLEVPTIYKAYVRAM